MIKSFSPTTCAFDCEWVPCPHTARRLLDLPPDCTDREATEAAWRAYAKEGEDRPFLKLVLCKVVTIAAVIRKPGAEGPELTLFSRSCDERGEAHLISSFLEAVAGGGYQLWGFNSASADLPILKQRAMALDAPLPKFSKRPGKPWEGPDYHDAHNSEAHKDILDQIGSYGGGASKPKLHELAIACGFPGKLDVHGGEVADLYLDGRVAEILQYNETDAVTTHLLMLRLAHVAGHLTDDAYACELLSVEQLVKEQAAKGKAQFARFWEAWKEGGAPERGAAAAGSAIARDQAGLLQAHWKEFAGEVKAAHGSQLAAALGAVRAVRGEGDAVVIFFGNNEFSCNLCRQHAGALTAILVAFLEGPGLKLDFQMGAPPAQ